MAGGALRCQLLPISGFCLRFHFLFAGYAPLIVSGFCLRFHFLFAGYARSSSVASAFGSTSSSRATPAHRQWNWPSSVEPVSAVVDEVGSTVVAIRSK